MAVDLELAPKQKRPTGEPCCEPVVYPDIERAQAERMARGGQGARRPGPDPARRRPAQARGQGLRLRAGAALRSLPADGLPPPQEAARRRHRRLRAPGPLGLLLRRARSTGGVVRMAELEQPARAADRRSRRRPAVAGERSCCGGDPIGAVARTQGTTRLVLLRRGPRVHHRRAARGLRLRPLRRRGSDATSERGAAGLARLRQPDRGRRPARGRDRPRPRLRRRHRRAPVGAPRRPDRQGLRTRHDRRDARAGPRQSGRGRRRERRVPQGRRSRTCRCRTTPST